MRAFVLSGYGAISDHVRLTEIPDPVASPGEVLIEIHAASLNPIDFKLAHGALKRISNYKLPRPIGFDASGIVRSVGAGASKFKPGEAVYVRASRDTIGTFAEQIALSEKFIALKPATLSQAEAASLPLVGLTTLQGLGRAGARGADRDRRRVRRRVARRAAAQRLRGRLPGAMTRFGLDANQYRRRTRLRGLQRRGVLE